MWGSIQSHHYPEFFHLLKDTKGLSTERFINLWEQPFPNGICSIFQTPSFQQQYICLKATWLQFTHTATVQSNQDTHQQTSSWNKAYATWNYHRDQQVNQLPRHLAGEGLQLSKGFLTVFKKSIKMSSTHSPDHHIPIESVITSPH